MAEQDKAWADMTRAELLDALAKQETALKNARSTQKTDMRVHRDYIRDITTNIDDIMRHVNSKYQ